MKLDCHLCENLSYLLFSSPPISKRLLLRHEIYKLPLYMRILLPNKNFYFVCESNDIVTWSTCVDSFNVMKLANMSHGVNTVL